MVEGRYFFALWPDGGVTERLNRVIQETVLQGRPQQPADLHMTLVFLGQVSEGQLHCIHETADAIQGGPFDLQLQGTGYWPRPRILWAGVKQPPAPLSQLVFDLQHGLRACGFEAERRRYQPHVTLYRKAVHAEPRVIEPAIDWSVREFVLAASGGGAPGEPRYRVVRRWPLTMRPMDLTVP